MATLVHTGMDSISGQFKIAKPGDYINGIPVVGGTPTLSILSAAGTGATGSISGTNLAGKITLNTGISLLSTGAVLSITFADGFAFPNDCVVLFSARDANFAAVLTKIFSTSNTTSGTLNTALSLSVSTTYSGVYTVIGW